MRALFLAAAALCLCLLSAGMSFADEGRYDGIVIRGEKGYIAEVKAALKLIKDNAPEEFELIKRNLKTISSAFRTVATPNLKMCELSSRTVFRSRTWCASSLAHESYHIELYHKYPLGHIKGAVVPYDAYGGPANERECNIFAVGVMQKINAPASETDFRRKADGKHADVNKDGRIDGLDYQEQDW